VLYVRGSGPVAFGERGIVLATQGARCEVIFEHEGFCSFGHFSHLATARAAVVPAAALLNLSRPPRGAAEAVGRHLSIYVYIEREREIDRCVCVPTRLRVNPKPRQC